MEQKKKIFALGFFDGVHLGHQALLNACARWQRCYGWEVAAITFDRHPMSLFSDTPPVLINSLEDRKTLLQRYGVKHIHTVAVNERSMGVSWDVFLEDLLADGAEGFVCGDDFRFGCRGEGNAQSVRDFADNRRMISEVIPEQTMEGLRISSTHIRSLLESGDVKTAAEFMGHRHILSGVVVPGRQLGRTIGVPTANILIPEGVVVPKQGVYACMAEVEGQKFAAVTNIGNRPTVGGHQVRAESWLLGFAGDLYGKTLTLEFADFLRPERKFASLEALQAQIQLDAAKTTEIL